MYLTAQRVYSLSRKRTGINAFLYRHCGSLVPGMSWENPAVEPVADEHVGVRGPEHVEIAPGGNRVLSFIDIVTADDTPVADVETAIRQLRDAVSTADYLPVTCSVGAIALRFGAQSGLPKNQLGEELATIAAQALDLLRQPHEPTWRTTDPLEVDVEKMQEGLRFTLRQTAKKRLAAIHGAGWSASRVTISHDTRESFELAHGDVFRNFVPVLTGLDPEAVADLGGMRFVDAGTGETLSEWPEP